MEQERPLQRAPPPAYTQHEPESLHLPSVPTHIPTHHPQDNGRLPGIKSLDLPDTKPRHTPHNSIEYSPRSRFETSQWGMLPALNNATFPRAPEGLPREDIGSPMDTASVRSMQDDGASRRETSVSMDDPDVRLAAEALSGLGNPGTCDLLMATASTARTHVNERLQTLFARQQHDRSHCLPVHPQQNHQSPFSLSSHRTIPGWEAP